MLSALRMTHLTLTVTSIFNSHYTALPFHENIKFLDIFIFCLLAPLLIFFSYKTWTKCWSSYLLCYRYAKFPYVLNFTKQHKINVAQLLFLLLNQEKTATWIGFIKNSDSELPVSDFAYPQSGIYHPNTFFFAALLKHQQIFTVLKHLTPCKLFRS